MFEHFSGTLERMAGELAVVDVGGVGYGLRVPASTAKALRVGQPVRLHASHRFQNDVFQLFGFASREEREVFDRICNVTGVGPSIALSILSALPIDAFRDVVLRGESKALEKVKGVGKKTAQRLILELRGALEEEDLRPAPTHEEPSGPPADAVKALIALGFPASEARSRVDRALGSLAPAAGETTVAELVRLASRG